MLFTLIRWKTAYVRKSCNSENILFRRDDFRDNSQLLSELSSFSELAKLVEKFKGICRLEFNNVPNLDQFIYDEYFNYPKITTSIRPIFNIRNQYDVVDGSVKNELLKHVGNRIEVIVFISHYHSGITRNELPYVFLNFGAYPNHSFTLVLWSSALDIFQQNGVNPKDYYRQWVRIFGVIGKFDDKPQISIDTPSQIKRLHANEANEALQRLKGKKNGRNEEEKELTNLYRDY